MTIYNHNRFLIKSNATSSNGRRKDRMMEPSTSKVAAETPDDSSSDWDEFLISSDESNSPQKKKNKRLSKNRLYHKSWEMQYKWLKQDHQTKRAICNACKQLLVCQKNHLDRHEKTSKHIENFKAASEATTIPITSFLPERTTHIKLRVAIAEIKLVLRMITNNHSFKSMDKLTQFNSSIYPDSQIAKSVR